MKTEINLIDIVNENDLQLIETTSQGNGDPSNLKYAIIGFDTFKQAKQLAEKYGLTISTFEKRDGWQLWYRANIGTFEPLENISKDFGDNYKEYSKMTEEEFFKSEIHGRDFSDFSTFEELQKMITKCKEVFDDIDRMDDDQMVVTLDGGYYEIIAKTSMYFYHNTHHCAIGLLDMNE